MKSCDALRHGLILLSALAVTACGGVQQLTPSMQTLSPGIARPGTQISPDWVFVSDPGTAQVFVYELPSLKLIQIIQGFTQPLGECSDSKGDVWLTDASVKTIYKLLHSGEIVGNLTDPNGYPDACAWDPKTGNLAVMNQLGFSSGSGAVLVYHKASGVPNIYYNIKQFYYDFGGYDSAGNLFFDGRTEGGGFILSELPVNASSAKSISISGGKIYNPGMVQWDSASHELVVGDQNCGNKTVSCIYRMTIANGRATIAGQTNLENRSGGAACDVIQAVLWKKSVVGSDYDVCGSGPSPTYVWPFPAGGKPSSHNFRYASAPFGAAISTKSAPDETPLAARDLLYISDSNGEVTVYTYLQKTLVGVLTGFTQPMGECVDKHGDVFITDYGAKQIVEYAHGGKKPIAKLDDSPYAPFACSVDSITGTLAVANEAGSSTTGNIALYVNARGTPKLLADKNIPNFQACAYDNGGNLLVSSGQADSRASYFAWLPKGGGKLVDVTIPGPSPSYVWRSVSALQWDGRFFVIGDYLLYRVSVIDGQGYYVGYTSLNNSYYGGGFWIYNTNPKQQGTQVVTPYSDSRYSLINYFNYPSGGDPFAQISHGIDRPTAVTISLGTTT